ncbi:BON domain-containing protein [Pokkaliibacter sp. CJK22405]|uniref:BON domain-containing protein n=1 Tax=Pokkaliibacter sp. CJK22405 TaxID=3384615 RepID=UPI003984FD88
MIRRIRTIAGIAILTTSTLVMAATNVPQAHVSTGFDAALTTWDIKKQLFWDDTVPASQISVSTDEGVVTLSGTVSSVDVRERAIRIATLADNVQRVVNSINVE